MQIYIQIYTHIGNYLKAFKRSSESEDCKYHGCRGLGKRRAQEMSGSQFSLGKHGNTGKTSGGLNDFMILHHLRISEVLVILIYFNDPFQHFPTPQKIIEDECFEMFRASKSETAIFSVVSIGPAESFGPFDLIFGQQHRPCWTGHRSTLNSQLRQRSSIANELRGYQQIFHNPIFHR